MKILIDGDALPNLLKPILIKAINREEIKTIVVSNKKVSIGKSLYIEYIVVPLGLDVADRKIVELASEKDLVITADIPLANSIVEIGATGLDHRGELFTSENIKQLLVMRNLMAEIRDSGEILKGTSPFSSKDAEKFANQLNAFLQKRRR